MDCHLFNLIGIPQCRHKNASHFCCIQCVVISCYASVHARANLARDFRIRNLIGRMSIAASCSISSCTSNLTRRLVPRRVLQTALQVSPIKWAAAAAATACSAFSVYGARMIYGGRKIGRQLQGQTWRVGCYVWWLREQLID